MPDHYFTNDPQSISRPKHLQMIYSGHSMAFLTDSGVFSCTELDAGTKLLLDALPDTITGRVLDLGCGWGAIGVCVGKCHPQAQITMTDVNSRALALASENAKQNQVTAEIILSDGFVNVTESFDYILSNPPIRAGKTTIYRLFAESTAHLLPGGSLCIVIRKQQGAPSTLLYLKTLFPRVSVAKKSGGYWVIICQGENNGL